MIIHVLQGRVQPRHAVEDIEDPKRIEQQQKHNNCGVNGLRGKDAFKKRFVFTEHRRVQHAEKIDKPDGEDYNKYNLEE